MKQDQKTIEVKMDKEWARLLAESVASREKRPPGKGWKTKKEIQDLASISKDAAKSLIHDMIVSGSLEKATGSMLVDGRLQVQTWYRIKKGTK